MEVATGGIGKSRGWRLGLVGGVGKMGGSKEEGFGRGAVEKRRRGWREGRLRRGEGVGERGG